MLVSMTIVLVLPHFSGGWF